MACTAFHTEIIEEKTRMTLLQISNLKNLWSFYCLRNQFRASLNRGRGVGEAPRPGANFYGQEKSELWPKSFFYENIEERIIYFIEKHHVNLGPLSRFTACRLVCIASACTSKGREEGNAIWKKEKNILLKIAMPLLWLIQCRILGLYIIDSTVMWLRVARHDGD